MNTKGMGNIATLAKPSTLVTQPIPNTLYMGMLPLAKARPDAPNTTRSCQRARRKDHVRVRQIIEKSNQNQHERERERKPCYHWRNPVDVPVASPREPEK